MFELKAAKVVEDEIMTRSGRDYDNPERQIRRVQYWNQGSIWLEERPDLSVFDVTKGLNLYDTFDFDDYSFMDGHHEFVFPPSISEEVRKRIIEVDAESDLTEDGWEVIESETWFFGPLVIEGE